MAQSVKGFEFFTNMQAAFASCNICFLETIDIISLQDGIHVQFDFSLHFERRLSFPCLTIKHSTVMLYVS